MSSVFLFYQNILFSILCNFSLMTLPPGVFVNVANLLIGNNERTALGKIRRSPWGAKKAVELYGQKKNQSYNSISSNIKYISFAESYLCNE
jgi:RNA polymerase primary sigma factor